jgi:hypothetical protein
MVWNIIPGKIFRTRVLWVNFKLPAASMVAKKQI